MFKDQYHQPIYILDILSQLLKKVQKPTSCNAVKKE